MEQPLDGGMPSQTVGRAGTIAITAIITAVIVGFGTYWLMPRATTPTESPTPVACTEEARLCPDGSSVGRVSPSCEFAACPISSPAPSVVDTTGWRTYSDQIYGFQFMYPSNMTPSVSDLSEQEDFGPAYSVTVVRPDRNGPFFSVYALGPTVGGAPTEPISYSDSTHDGIMVTKYLEWDINQGIGPKTKMLRYNIRKNDTGAIFKVYGWGVVYSVEIEKLADQILSTFRFTK